MRQAPAPPLRHHAARQIADLAQPPAREVAGKRHHQRHQHVPQPPDGEPQAPCVLQPVAAAAADRDHARHALAPRHQPEDLPAEAVAEPVDRCGAWQFRCKAAQRRRRVLFGPGEHVGLEAAQRAAARRADAAVVEAQHRMALRCQPRCEVRIEALRHAHGRDDQHPRHARGAHRRAACHATRSRRRLGRRPCAARSCQCLMARCACRDA